MCIPANLNDLRHGIKAFLDRDWPTCFHNGLYRELSYPKRNYDHSEWWNRAFLILQEWGAMAHYPAERVDERARRGLFRKVWEEYQNILDEIEAGEVPFEEVAWNNFSKIFGLAQQIKPVRSPMFASKLCHFLLPGYFVPYDHAFVCASGEYQEYWLQRQREWRCCSCKDRLTNELRRRIAPPVFRRYPFATKIVELCRAGRIAARGNGAVA